MKHVSFAAAIFLGLLAFQPAFAQSSGVENTARENAKADAERQARAEIESLLARLCPGRCELVDVDVTVGETQLRGQVAPGFEDSAPGSYDVDVERIEATVMMDSTLPENFQANIPRMAQFRLQEVADNVVIRPELLEFPNPQLPPSPEGLPESPPQPEPAFEPPTEPPPAEPEPTDAEEVDDEEPADTDEPAWAQALPWIALLMTLLILGGLIILILRRLEALADQNDRPSQPASSDEESSTPVTMPDTDALRAELGESRSVLNRTLRRWLKDDPEEVAMLVRLIGPDVLSDLRRDPELRPSLELVSDHVASLDDRIDPETAQTIARKARSRYDAQRVIDDASPDTEWEFLEGLTLAQITELLENTSRRERSFVLTRLPPALRSRYLEQLDSRRRRRLMMEAGSEESLSRTESKKLAGRLRRLADEMPDAGADGRAAMLVEMLEAMALPEQTDVLQELRGDRPDVADAVLAQLCLETALAEIPEEMVADAVHRLPVDTLAIFLRGTADGVSDHILEVAPASKRQAVATELSLEIPTTKADYLDARSEFTGAVIEILRRNGLDIAQYNRRALQRTAEHPTHPEVTG